MRIRLIGSVIAAFGLSTFGTSASASAVDRIPPLLSAPSADDNMPRARTGEAIPIPELLTYDGPWAQPLPPAAAPAGALAPPLRDGGVHSFESPEEFERAMQWRDVMQAFERLLPNFQG